MNNHKLAGQIYAQLISAAIQAGELSADLSLSRNALADMADDTLTAEAIFYGEVAAVEEEGKEQ